MQGQFLLYGGRIDAGKGCEELIEYFTSYKEQGGDAQLALMGVKLMQLPEVPWVRFAGLLSERERLQALEAATIVVVPSPLRKPVAAGARGDGGRHPRAVQRARGRARRALHEEQRRPVLPGPRRVRGVHELLLADDRLRDRMGRNGKEYVKKHYRWDVIMSEVDKLIGATPW